MKEVLIRGGAMAAKEDLKDEKPTCTRGVWKAAIKQ